MEQLKKTRQKYKPHLLAIPQRKSDWRTEPARELLCAGWRYIKTITRARDRKASDMILRHAADLGDTWAQYFLGLYATDETQAVCWLRKAAKGGNPFAQYALAVKYIQGCAGQRNKSRAENWFRKSAAQIGWGTAELQRLQRNTKADSGHSRPQRIIFSGSSVPGGSPSRPDT